ncbi:hypothetical protein EJ02DRAFT_47320 [Clathrospora elynae]|uniref:Uncharacterized protein n=1 Tax=Clathrospora elynae TaxID=706981 RepID=A0A6A5SAU7_9PLEO|nr:hypothetical protein EJ02DRAFT_47320 [Clathrospora elynae]
MHWLCSQAKSSRLPRSSIRPISRQALRRLVMRFANPIFFRVRAPASVLSRTSISPAMSACVLICWSDDLLSAGVMSVDWVDEGSERDACINRSCRRKLCLHEFHIKATYMVYVRCRGNSLDVV